MRNSLLPVRLPCTDSEPLTSHARVPENPVAPNVVCVKMRAGGQLHQHVDLTAVERQLRDALVLDRLGDRALVRLDRARLRADRHRLLQPADGELKSSVTVSAVRSVTPSRTNVLKPDSVAEIRTGPGWTRWTVKTPASLVIPS